MDYICRLIWSIYLILHYYLINLFHLLLRSIVLWAQPAGNPSFAYMFITQGSRIMSRSAPMFHSCGNNLFGLHCGLVGWVSVGWYSWMGFLLLLIKFSFWRGDWALGDYLMRFYDFIGLLTTCETTRIYHVYKYKSPIASLVVKRRSSKTSKSLKVLWKWL